MKCQTQNTAQENKIDFFENNFDFASASNPKLRLWLQINDYEQSEKYVSIFKNIYQTQNMN